MIKSTKIDKNKLLLLTAIAIGIFIRLWQIDSIPYGLNQDEASIGYEAFSILNYFTDRNGVQNPIHLIAWGSGQNIAYCWLIMPFIKLLGLSVLSIRLPMAIAGCISVWAFYLFFKLIYTEKYAGLSALFFAVYPWHIIKSRWALDCNIFPDLVLWAVVFLAYYLKQKNLKFLYISCIIFAFSVYSYGTSYLFIPLFLGGVWIYMYLKKQISLKHFILTAVLVFVLTFPIILFILVNTFSLNQFSFMGFTVPKLYQERFSTIGGMQSGIFLNFFNHLKTFMSILLNQTDGLIWNGMPYWGICYIFLLPFIPLGIIISFVKKYFIINWFFICSMIVVLFTDTNINRINIVFIPTAFYICIALTEISQKIKFSQIYISVCLIVFFAVFAHAYFTDYAQNLKSNFHYSYKEALQTAVNFDSDKIYVYTDINQPYILTLFYTEENPYNYIDTVEFYNEKQAFEFIKSYGKYCFFMPEALDYREDAVYIVNNYNQSMFDSNYFNFIQYELYTVVYPKT